MNTAAILINVPDAANDPHLPPGPPSAPLDPDLAAWAESVDAWLKTPEGRRWLASMEEMEDERHGRACWEGPRW